MPRVPWWAAASSISAPVLLIGGWTAAAAVQPVGFDSAVRTISDLAASQTPHRAVMTVALTGLGLCHVVTARGLLPAAVAGRLALGLGGVATVLVAAFPLPAAGASSSAHSAAAGVSFIALSVWPVLGSARGRRAGQCAGTLLSPRVSAAATGALLLALAWFLAERQSGGQLQGLTERVAAGAQALWPLAVVLSVRRTQRRAA